MKDNVKSAYKKVLRILSAVLTAALALLLCINLYTIAAKVIFKVKQPMVFGYASAVVVSGSMSGSIEVNDLILIHRQNAYEKGDIITFYSGGTTVTHRVVGAAGQGYRTKGDANNTEDADPVAADQVIGKVVCVIPKAGAVISFLLTPLGMTCLVLVTAALIGLPELISKKKNQGGTRNENEQK